MSLPHMTDDVREPYTVLLLLLTYHCSTSAAFLKW